MDGQPAGLRFGSRWLVGDIVPSCIRAAVIAAMGVGCVTGPAARTPAESPQSPDALRRARRRSPGEQDSTAGPAFVAPAAHGVVARALSRRNRRNSSRSSLVSPSRSPASICAWPSQLRNDCGETPSSRAISGTPAHTSAPAEQPRPETRADTAVLSSTPRLLPAACSRKHRSVNRTGSTPTPLPRPQPLPATEHGAPVAT